MKHEAIENLIDSLNVGSMQGRIFLVALTETVDFAKVWLNDPRGLVANEGSYDFFFIKSDEGIYVAAVFDMHSDLHVFVKKEYRKKGILSAAMNSVVLPKLYQSGRTTQRVTFKEAGMGVYCVRNWGFTLTGDESAEIDLQRFSEAPIFLESGALLTRGDWSHIQAHLNRSELYLKMVKERLELSYVAASNESLDLVLSEFSYLADEVQDTIESKQGRLAE